MVNHNQNFSLFRPFSPSIALASADIRAIAVAMAQNGFRNLAAAGTGHWA
jgi:hypothetical protein